MTYSGLLLSFNRSEKCIYRFSVKSSLKDWFWSYKLIVVDHPHVMERLYLSHVVYILFACNPFHVIDMVILPVSVLVIDLGLIFGIRYKGFCNETVHSDVSNIVHTANNYLEIMFFFVLVR